MIYPAAGLDAFRPGLHAENLQGLVDSERYIEQLLEESSRQARDPRARVYLWETSKECRDHARTLYRHLMGTETDAENEADPSGFNNVCKINIRNVRDPLALAIRESLGLKLSYQEASKRESERYLKKFLEILSKEHRELGRNFALILAGAVDAAFPIDENFGEVLQGRITV